MVTSEWLEAQAAIYKVQAKSEAQDDRQLEALHMRLIAEAFRELIARRAADEGAVVVDVSSPGEADAGMRPFTDTVRVSCESGDFGGEADGEFSFAEIFRSFVAEWYDGPAVTIRRRSVEKAGA